MEIVWVTPERVDWTSFSKDSCILGGCDCFVFVNGEQEVHTIKGI